LAELYETGNGVEKDLAIARELYEDAAARGVPGAKQRLAALPPTPPQAPNAAPTRKPPNP
jgi:TPR repeat protein